MKHFSASGEEGLVSKYRKSGAEPEGGLESVFVVSVCDVRDKDDQPEKTNALVDFMWGVWGGHFD